MIVLRPFFFYIILPGLLLTACKSTQPVVQLDPPPAIELEGKHYRISPTDGLEKPLTTTVVAVGDMMPGTNFPDSSYLPPNGGKDLLTPVLPVFEKGNVVFGNLEATVLDEGGDPKFCSNPSLCYLFRVPRGVAQTVKDAGFDVVSTANNHAGDFGDPGRTSTMRWLDSVGIHHAGQLAQPYTTFRKDGLTYGLVAFSPNDGTLSIYDVEGGQQIVKHLDSICDVVMVSFHGGAEGADHQHVTRKTEMFYGENRGNVYEFAHAMIDAGGDLILGHGPHVLRAMELYKDRFIVYSMGNFNTYARFSLSGPKGLAPVLELVTDDKGRFLVGQIHDFVQVGEGGPIKDPAKLSTLKFKELTESDFPETGLSIDSKGTIRLK